MHTFDQVSDEVSDKVFDLPCGAETGASSSMPSSGDCNLGVPAISTTASRGNTNSVCTTEEGEHGEGKISSSVPSLLRGEKFSVSDLAAGAGRVRVVLRARAMRAEVPPRKWEEIAAATGYPLETVWKWVDRVAHIATPTAADLAPRKPPGRPRRIQVEAREVAALQANYLVTNRTADAGSAEEAARMALRKGELTPELAETLRARDAAGQPLLTESIRREVILPSSTVRQYRNPTEAGLDYLSCPGSLKFVKDRISGQERFARAGDILEMDDATINFPVCVPWDRAGLPDHPCADKYGVIVGRFQWLVCIDVGELYVPGWSYTARPRSSYRGEDILATLRGVFRQHGVWERCRFERGVFESKLVVSALERLGVELITVHSPHTKAFIEGLFNVMWTKLSDLPGQVGRFQGEMEEENKLVRSCQRAAQDPTHYFPLLSDAIAAFTRATGERNSQWVRSKNYGEWIPEQRFELRKGLGSFTPLASDTDWIFSPCVRTWTVRGACVGGSVPFFEGLSVRFDFSMPELLEWDGRQVQCFFDPFAPDASAVVCAAEAANGARVGEVIGRAEQINKVARYARRMFGYGEDEDRAVEIMKRNAQAMRREVRAVLPGGKAGVAGVAITEVRDGLGNAVEIRTGNAECRMQNAESEERQKADRRQNRIELPRARARGGVGVSVEELAEL